MTQSGGSADKLGNYFEGHWTVWQLLQMLDNRTKTFCLEHYELPARPEDIHFEPLGNEGVKAEFILHFATGIREHHQVKIRTSGQWTLQRLEGKGVLTAFEEKLNNPNVWCVFVSNKNAEDLYELSERARIATSFAAFENEVLGKEWGEVFRKLLGFWKETQPAQAWEKLKRVRVQTIDRHTLLKTVDGLILSHFVSPPPLVRLAMADLAVEHLHKVLTAHQIWECLKQKDITPRDWSQDTRWPLVIQDITRGFQNREVSLPHVLPRTETERVVSMLENPANTKRLVVLTGAAGLGKSEVLQSVVENFTEQHWPVLAFRLDRVELNHRSGALEEQFKLPSSPVNVLADVAAGQPALLVIDQLDAVSTTSGRNTPFFKLVSDMLQEAAAHPNLQVLLACRAFDLHHDVRFRKLVDSDQAPGIEVSLSPLTRDQVVETFRAAGVNPEGFTIAQFALLENPLHLHLFLQGHPASGFQTVVDLYNAFWQAKQQRISEQIPGFNLLQELSPLADTMAQKMVLKLPEVYLDKVQRSDLLFTEGLLVRKGRDVAFFHEGFFDYLFARQFYRSGQRLLDLLGNEQHLFKRAQVRQVLLYLRDNDKVDYKRQLSDLLLNDNVRFHIKHLVLHLLGTLQHPTEGEWEVVRRLLESPDRDLYLQAWRLSTLPTAWYKWFWKVGWVQRWFNSENFEERKSSEWALFTLMREQPDQFLEFAKAYLVGPEDQKNALLGIFSMGIIPPDRPLFEFWLELVRTGRLSEGPFWRNAAKLSTREPVWVVEALQVFLELQNQALDAGILASHQRNAAGWFAHHEDARRTLQTCSQQAPRQLIEGCLPLLLEFAEHNGTHMDNGFIWDPVFCVNLLWQDSNILATEWMRAVILALVNLSENEFSPCTQILESSSLIMAKVLLMETLIGRGGGLQNLVSFLQEHPDCLPLAKLSGTLQTLLSHPDWDWASEGGQLLQNLLLRHPEEDWVRVVLQSVKEANRIPAVDTWLTSLLSTPFPPSELQDRSAMVEAFGLNTTLQWTDQDWIDALTLNADVEGPAGSTGIRVGVDKMASVLREAVEHNPVRFVQLANVLPLELNEQYPRLMALGFKNARLDVDQLTALIRRVLGVAGSVGSYHVPDLYAERASAPWSDEALVLLGDVGPTGPMERKISA